MWGLVKNILSFGRPIQKANQSVVVQKSDEFVTDYRIHAVFLDLYDIGGNLHCLAPQRIFVDEGRILFQFLDLNGAYKLCTIGDMNKRYPNNTDYNEAMEFLKANEHTGTLHKASCDKIYRVISARENGIVDTPQTIALQEIFDQVQKLRVVLTDRPQNVVQLDVVKTLLHLATLEGATFSQMANLVEVAYLFTFDRPMDTIDKLDFERYKSTIVKSFNEIVTTLENESMSDSKIALV